MILNNTMTVFKCTLLIVSYINFYFKSTHDKINIEIIESCFL